MIFVLAFPRSGTKRLAITMQEAGLDVGHETLKTFGGVGYMFAKDKYRPKLARADLICHMFRNPLYCIASANANLARYNIEGALLNGSGYEKAWADYNKKFERILDWAESKDIPTFAFPAEDMEFGAEVILNCFGKEFAGLSNEINHRADYEPLSWRDLSHDTKALAERFGYL